MIALATSSGVLSGRLLFCHEERRSEGVNVVFVSHGAMAEICDSWVGKIWDEARRKPIIYTINIVKEVKIAPCSVATYSAFGPLRFDPRRYPSGLPTMTHFPPGVTFFRK